MHSLAENGAVGKDLIGNASAEFHRAHSTVRQVDLESPISNGQRPSNRVTDHNGSLAADPVFGDEGVVRAREQLGVKHPATTADEGRVRNGLTEPAWATLRLEANRLGVSAVSVLFLKIRGERVEQGQQVGEALLHAS